MWRIAAVVSLVVAASARAQVSEQITVERILVDARVTDTKGTAITGLKAADFVVRIDGKPAKVETADWIPESAVARELADLDKPQKAEVNKTLDQPAPRGRLLVFLFQTDFARNESRVIGHQQLLVGADQWIDWLDEEDRVAVFSYDSHLKFRLDFTGNKDHIKDAMQRSLYTDEPPPPRMVPMPSLARRLDAKEMKDASTPERALIILANALRSIPGPKSLILFGWGLGRLSGGRVWMDAKYPAARYALESARVSVFSIDFSQADAHSLSVGLGQVAGDTGGFYASTFRFPRQAIERLQKTLDGHYELEVRKPDTKVKGMHTIEVEVPRRDATVLARSTYVDSE